MRENILYWILITEAKIEQSLYDLEQKLKIFWKKFKNFVQEIRKDCPFESRD